MIDRFEFRSDVRRAFHMPWELKELIDPAKVEIGPDELDLVRRLDDDCDGLRSSHARVDALELVWYMRNATPA